ncbi:MAG TPA: hypothetical protein VH164_10840 [Ktedonobacteraceae bacterium]|nr:hypothetical protein [Ktedonobacteraceae bacterium]
MAGMERENPPDDLEIEFTDLDHTHKRRLTPRLRRWSLALMVLVIGMILASVVNVRSLLEGSLLKPSHTIGSSHLSVYLQGNPSWGQFTVDGKLVVSFPQAAHNTPLMLTPGPHHITWQAAPFRPQNCVVTVVDALTVTSPCLLSGIISTGLGPSSSLLTLFFFASLNDLSSDQRAALIAQVQTVEARYALSETVRPEEVYAISEQKIEANPSLCSLVTYLVFCHARATQPLLATLRLQLDTSTSRDDPCIGSGQCVANQQDCRSFCADPRLSQPGQFVAAKGWDVAVLVQLLWSYSTLSGQVVAQDQPDSALRSMQAYQTVSLQIDRGKQGWLVVPFSSETDSGVNDPFCNQGAGDIQGLLNASSNTQQIYVQQSFHTAADCLEIAGPPPFEGSAMPTLTPATNAPQKAIFLVRFGVVLAVNEVAQHLLPSLPVADPYEKSMAQRLLAALPASS